MILSCFRTADSPSSQLQLDDAPRPLRSLTFPGTVRNKASLGRRQESSESRCSATSSSNDTVFALPTHTRISKHKLEAMMMPIPPEPRPSRCLRLSQPKTFSAIIDGMKTERGCRDWRSFAVFHQDEIDPTLSAANIAHKRVMDCQQKIHRLNSVPHLASHSKTIG